MMSLVYRTMMAGGSAIIESGTGSGKTVGALAGALAYCVPEGKTLIYVTRTNSQAKQVMAELRAISEVKAVCGLAFQGRRHACLMVREGMLEGVEAADLAKFCEQRKKRSMRKEQGGCPFFENYVREDAEDFRDFAMRELPTAEEFIDFCESKGACAYEAMKDLTAQAQVIVTSYPYIISPDVRDMFLEMLSLEPSQCAIVVDEAHNMMDFAREAESLELEVTLVEAAESESRAFGNAKLAGKVGMGDLCPALAGCICSFAQRARESGSKEMVLGHDELERVLAERLGVTTEELGPMAERMRAQGESIVQARLKKDEPPASATLALGELLFRWFAAGPGRFKKYVSDGLPPVARAYCLDPAGALRIFHQCHASVHMSGTLQPLMQYADLVGLPEAAMVSYPSPFPRENRLVLYAEDVTTEWSARSDEGNMRRMEEHVVSLVKGLRRRTMVIFPSYELMRRFCDMGLEEELGVPVFKEEQALSQDRLMRMVESFKSSRVKGALLSAAQGRVCEGLDFPEEDLELVIVVGIPYPPPTIPQKALERYCAQRFGEWKGREYASNVPAYRKMAQAIGRLIRTERDVGAAVILDRRARHFSKYMEIKASADLVGETGRFFDSRERRR